jgi:hypothetical protein
MVSAQGKQAILKEYERASSIAREFERRCLRIITSKHGADPNGIDANFFYDLAMGRIISGKGLPEPEVYVEKALEIFYPWALGLAPRPRACPAKSEEDSRL